MLANDTSGLAVCSTEFGRFFGNNVGNDDEGYDCSFNAEQNSPLLHILSNNTKLVNYNRRHLFTRFLPSSFTNFLPEQVNLERQWEIAISEISYPSLYQNKMAGKFSFFDEKLSKSTTTYNLEPGLYTSITDIVQAMNTLIQEKKHSLQST